MSARTPESFAMLVPPGLSMMSDADKRGKYPGANAPAYVLTNDDWSINIAFDHKKSR